jgi:hypothetical protein
MPNELRLTVNGAKQVVTASPETRLLFGVFALWSAKMLIGWESPKLKLSQRRERYG